MLKRAPALLPIFVDNSSVAHPNIMDKEISARKLTQNTMAGLWSV